MAVTPAKTWIAGEVLTAADLNGEFLNVYSNGQTIGFPRTASADFDGQSLILDVDGDTSITADTDDQIDFAVGGDDVMVLTATKLTFLGDRVVTETSIRRIQARDAAKVADIANRVANIEHNYILESQVFS